MVDCLHGSSRVDEVGNSNMILEEFCRHSESINTQQHDLQGDLGLEGVQTGREVRLALLLLDSLASGISSRQLAAPSAGALGAQVQGGVLRASRGLAQLVLKEGNSNALRNQHPPFEQRSGMPSIFNVRAGSGCTRSGRERWTCE